MPLHFGFPVLIVLANSMAFAPAQTRSEAPGPRKAGCKFVCKTDHFPSVGKTIEEIGDKSFKQSSRIAANRPSRQAGLEHVRPASPRFALSR